MGCRLVDWPNSWQLVGANSNVSNSAAIKVRIVLFIGTLHLIDRFIHEQLFAEHRLNFG